MTDNGALAPTHAAIRIWKQAYFAGHVPSMGYPSENVIYRIMRGTALTSGADTFWPSEKEQVADQVNTAVGYLRAQYDRGHYAKDLARPFIAYHLHVINGERAMHKGRPWPAKRKADAIGLSRASFFRRVAEATEMIHSILSAEPLDV